MSTTVYYKRDDLDYRVTKAWLDDRGIRYAEVDMMTDPTVKGRIESDGLFGNPAVYVTGPGFLGRWDGFKPNLLHAYLGREMAA